MAGARADSRRPARSAPGRGRVSDRPRRNRRRRRIFHVREMSTSSNAAKHQIQPSDATARAFSRKRSAAARARVGIVGPGLRGLAAGRGVRQGRLRGHRNRHQRGQDPARQCRRFLRGRYSQCRPWRRWSNPASCAPPPIFRRSLELDTINICVPTPLRKTKDPDMSYIVSACQEIAQYFHAGNAGDSGIHHLSRHHRRTGAAHARQIRPEGRDAISSSASRPSASIPAIPSTRRPTFPK